MCNSASALSVTSDEVVVIPNELLEAHIVSIRTDFTDLRAEVRAVVLRIDQDVRGMAAKAEAEIRTAVARIDEQFREVRQDIRELRADNKTLRDKMDGNYSSLEGKIGESHASLDKKIDVKTAELRADINELRADFKELRGGIADVKGMQKAMFWFFGSLGTLAGLAGAGFTIAKALHWI